MFAAYMASVPTPADEVHAAYLELQFALIRRLPAGSVQSITYLPDEPAQPQPDQPQPLHTVSSYARLKGINGWNANLSNRFSRRATDIMTERGQSVRRNSQNNRLYPSDVLAEVFSAIS